MPPRKCAHFKVESDREGYRRMKRCRFTEEQIIGILQEQESGLKVSDLCRKHEISDATFYKWKARYGGLEVSKAKTADHSRGGFGTKVCIAVDGHGRALPFTLSPGQVHKLPSAFMHCRGTATPTDLEDSKNR